MPAVNMRPVSSTTTREHGKTVGYLAALNKGKCTGGGQGDGSEDRNDKAANEEDIAGRVLSVVTVDRAVHGGNCVEKWIW